MSPWKGEEPRVYDLPCEDTVCPPDSFCLGDEAGGGSRCHYSEDGLLLYCGENEGGRGDFTSLALVRGKLHYSLTVGYRRGQLLSDSAVVLGHGTRSPSSGTGMSGWLRLEQQHTCVCRSQGFSLLLPLFNASVLSYAAVPWPQAPRSYLSFTEVEMTFRPSLADGTLLYSDDAQSADFMAVSLVDGYVEFRFDCGSGSSMIRSLEPVAMDTWHELKVSRTAKSGILQVDGQRPTEGVAEGAFHSDKVQLRSVRSVESQAYDQGPKPNAAVAQTLHRQAVHEGTLVLNDRGVSITSGAAGGVNVANAAHPCVDGPCANGGSCRPKWDGYECDCPLGYDGRHCQKGQRAVGLRTVNLNLKTLGERKSVEPEQLLVSSTQDTSLCSPVARFPGGEETEDVYGEHSVSVLHKPSARRRTRRRSLQTDCCYDDGLFCPPLWKETVDVITGDRTPEHLSPAIMLNVTTWAGGPANVVVNGSFGDGRWHRVKAVRDGQSGKLTVDDYGAKTGRSAGQDETAQHQRAFIRGMKEVALHTNRRHAGGLVGCVSHLTLSTDFHVGLVEDAADGKNINTCTN
ncbi:hypothetical protein CRUP_022181 [Coryphaenoides rupestris]|nr:hypothetical protein CRUP_022181 [Coryphaenoides rupestris]